MSSVNSILKFISKYGNDEMLEKIGGSSRLRNINADRLRAIFNDKGDRDNFLRLLRDYTDEFMLETKPRFTGGMMINNDDDFVRKVNKIKLNQGGLQEMKMALDEYKNISKCKCQNKKRQHNGNIVSYCNCNE